MSLLIVDEKMYSRSIDKGIRILQGPKMTRIKRAASVSFFLIRVTLNNGKIILIALLLF